MACQSSLSKTKMVIKGMIATALVLIKKGYTIEPVTSKLNPVISDLCLNFSTQQDSMQKRFGILFGLFFHY